MTSPEDARKLADAVEKTRERRRRLAEGGPRALLRNLSLVGSLGWMLVLPTLAGALLGRWLDRRFGSGVFWSATLIFAGAVAGGSLVWNQVRRS
jgi:ATP synthase protein I